MTFIARLFMASFLLVAVCAFSQEVHYNYDRGANFAAYKTYRWVDLDGAVPDQLIDSDIKRAIDEQLAEKGLVKVEKDADLYVGYRAVIREEKAVDLWGTGGTGWGGWWGPGWGGFNSAHGQTSTIPVGTLLIDLYDRAKKQLVWRGDATKSVDLKRDPAKNYRALQKAMAKLFKNYPPQSGK